jgi:dipeptidase D
MSNPLQGLEPAALWRRFYELSRIPRPSGHEQAASDWTVPATAGKESAPVVILQGHLDMIPEKEKSSPHNFETDPIPVKLQGDWVETDGTTLGADNGIGLAAAMAAAEDPGGSHGPLELLVTVDEERGLRGASALKPGFVNGTYLLNLDSEEEGMLFVGCAGGADAELVLESKTRPAPSGWTPLTIAVDGLKGGHSGLEIHTGRGNAIKFLTRLLRRACSDLDLQVVSFTGGSRRNAIPRQARAELLAQADDVEKLSALCADRQEMFRTELGKADRDLTITVERQKADPPPSRTWTEGLTGTVLDLLAALPHGVSAMSREIPGVVETSTNLATVTSEGETLTVGLNTRSSVQTILEETRQGILAAGRLAGGRAVAGHSYPGWRPDMDANLLKVARSVLEEIYGKPPLTTAIHAGLECGILSERIPGAQLISFGPDIHGAHTPQEKVSVRSTATFYKALCTLLERLSS